VDLLESPVPPRLAQHCRSYVVTLHWPPGILAHLPLHPVVRPVPPLASPQDTVRCCPMYPTTALMRLSCSALTIEVPLWLCASLLLVVAVQPSMLRRPVPLGPVSTVLEEELGE
jgi:hypothetical protein